MAVTQSAINASWDQPTKNADTVHEYVVNVTTLRSFDAPFTGLGYGAAATEPSSILGTSSVSKPIGNTSAPIINGTFGIDISSEEKVEAQMRQIKVSSNLQSILPYQFSHSQLLFSL